MTYAPPTLTELARYWQSQGGVNLGVVGDTRHVAKGRSYHLGRSALTADAYSRTTHRDRAGLTEAASALDLGKLGGSYPKLRAFSVWLVERCQTNATGTQDIREVIYSPDGHVVLRWDRERGLASEPKPNEADASHIGHTHVSFYRDSEKRAKVGAFAPYFAPVQEAPVADPLIRSAEAVVTNAEYLLKEVTAGDVAGREAKAILVIKYAARFLPTSEAVAAGDEPDEPLSTNASIAQLQLLARAGHPATLTENGTVDTGNLTLEVANDPSVSDEIKSELALLGFFGVPGTWPNVGYALWERYYEISPVTGVDAGGQPLGGNPVIKAGFQGEGNRSPWGDYLASKS